MASRLLRTDLLTEVRNELSKRLKDKKAALALLGRPRDSSSEQAQFLMEIATAFTETLNKALSTMYASEEFDRYPELKLATLVVNRIYRFSDMVLEYGHLYEFDCYEKLDDTGVRCQTREVQTPDDLIEMLEDGSELREPLQINIFEWLEQVYEKSRGFELGTVQVNSLLFSHNPFICSGTDD